MEEIYRPERESFLEKYAPPVIIFVAILILWEVIVVSFKVPDYLFPAPHEVFLKGVELKTSLFIDTIITLFEAVLCFILGCGIGILIAIGFAHSRTLELSIYPYAIALKTIPIIAIAPLLILWFGNGIPAKIIISALICFFPAIVNTVKGLKAVDEDALNLFRSLSATRWQMFKMLRFPNSLPYIFSALKISSSFSIIGAIVGEFAGADKGLGFFILQSSYWLRTTEMFVAIIIISIAGIVFFGLISLIERLMIKWQETELETV